MFVNPNMTLNASLIRQGLALAMAAVMLTGCGSSKPTAKPAPRAVMATFDGQSVDQVRTALMVACTNEKWTIRSKAGEVSCHNNQIESRRYDVIERLANDPVGQRYSENIRFEIEEDGATVSAKGQASIQYVVSGGFFTSATLKTVDLDDDPAIEQIRKILTLAKGKLK